MNAVLFNYPFIREFRKKVSWFPQMYCLHLFIDQQISILKWFLKGHVTLKIGVTAAENSVLHHNKLHFKMLKLKKNSNNYVLNIIVLMCIWSNKCSLGKHKGQNM